MDEWLGGIKYAIYVFIVIVVYLEISLGIKGYDFYNSSKEQKATEELREEPWCKYRGFFIFQLKFHSINRHKDLQKKGGIN